MVICLVQLRQVKYLYNGTILDIQFTQLCSLLYSSQGSWGYTGFREVK